jgi:hypothetical protein
MRHPKIVSRQEKGFVLEVPLREEFLFVQNAARQWAETQGEFNEMCLTGLKAAQNFKGMVYAERYESNVFWIVRTHILKLKAVKTSL